MHARQHERRPQHEQPGRRQRWRRRRDRNVLNDDVTYLLPPPNETQVVGFASRTAFVTFARRF